MEDNTFQNPINVAQFKHPVEKPTSFYIGASLALIAIIIIFITSADLFFDSKRDAAIARFFESSQSSLNKGVNDKDEVIAGAGLLVADFPRELLLFPDEKISLSKKERKDGVTVFETHFSTIQPKEVVYTKFSDMMKKGLFTMTSFKITSDSYNFSAERKSDTLAVSIKQLRPGQTDFSIVYTSKR